MDEASQVRGCYNFYLYTNQETVQALPCDENMNTGHNSKQTTCLCRDTWGKRDAADDELMLNVLRCQLTY